MTYHSKRYVYNNEDEDKSPNILHMSEFTSSFGLVSLFNCISFIIKKTDEILFGLMLVEDKKANTFPKYIYPKVNIIPWLLFELAYFEAGAQHIGHYVNGTSLIFLLINLYPLYDSFEQRLTFPLDLVWFFCLIVTLRVYFHAKAIFVQQ